jgi:hypothetical protein
MLISPIVVIFSRAVPFSSFTHRPLELPKNILPQNSTQDVNYVTPDEDTGAKTSIPWRYFVLL